MSSGITTTYALHRLEERGQMFVEPRVNVYEGMIVGESNKDTDLVVNVTEEKNLTNTRSATKDNTIVLKSAKVMTLEACLEFINDDELVEVTPRNIRLRKYYLSSQDRKKYFKKNFD